MLASRVRASLEAAGHEVTQAPHLEPNVLNGAELVVADLDTTPPEDLASCLAPVIGFHMHTNVEVKERAQKAGLALVVPRSRMARELPQLADELLG
jgi:hypothetical protein